MSATNEFVQKLLAHIDKGTVHSEAVSKLVNGFVKSLEKEKKEEKKANKEANKNGKNGKDKPKTDKPLNPYMLYCIAKRQSIVDATENKGKPPKEITSILAKEWRKERDQKSQFVKDLQQQAEAASLKYKTEKDEKKKSIAEKSGESESENEESKKKKRAPSAYNVFYSQMMEQLKEEGVDVSEIPKAISEKWKNLSEEEKKSFKGKELTPKKTKKAEKPDAPLKVKKTSKKADAEEEDKPDCARALDFSEKKEKEKEEDEKGGAVKEKKQKLAKK
jgi:hypothetical protein